jgi:hypothetical protein
MYKSELKVRPEEQRLEALGKFRGNPASWFPPALHTFSSLSITRVSARPARVHSWKAGSAIIVSI